MKVQVDSEDLHAARSGVREALRDLEAGLPTVATCRARNRLAAVLATLEAMGSGAAGRDGP